MVGTNSGVSNDTTQQFQAMFNYATIGIVVTDKKGKIINFNACAEAQFGYSKEEILGSLIEKLVPDQFHPAHMQQRDQYYHHPEPRTMGAGRDLYAKRKDNSVFPVEVSLSHFVFNEQVYVIAFVIDITVRKNSESKVLAQKEELETITRQLMDLNAELEQRVQDRTKMLRETLAQLERSKTELSEALESEKELGDLKTGFVTLASHEFRTPLSTILSSAYLLEQYTGSDPKTVKHVQRIKKAVGSMKIILEDFLSLGKLEEGLIQMKKEICTAEQCCSDISSIVDELDQMLMPGQEIIVECSGSSDVYTDRNLLKNILLNLLSNALKFSPDGSPVKLNCNFTPVELTISVSDSGIGISPEDQQHLFERFFRASNAANIQGTGLGLHIVGKYLGLLGGSIEIRSSLDHGSTFTINLPAGEPKNGGT
jgi:PAS domain S-box-containing protein